MRDWAEVRAIIERRRREDSPLKQRMIEIRDRFNGDFVYPLPASAGEPVLPITMPNLVADMIETQALQASSVDPRIVAPALDQDKPRSMKRAGERRRAWKAAWYHSQMGLLRRRSYRHIIGYGYGAFIVTPDFEKGSTTKGRARIETRDALTTYPDRRDPDDIRRAEDCAFVMGRSAAWLLSQFGPGGRDILTSRVLERVIAARAADEMWDVVEWVDHDDIVLGLLGPRTREYHPRGDMTDAHGLTQVLARWPNRANRCPAVVGQRVTLDRIAGSMDAMLPTYDLANRIMGLEVDAMERAIYPDVYVTSSDNREPILASGAWADGRTGQINRIQNASQVGTLQTQPSPMTTSIVDRLESSVRQSAGVNALASGLQPGSLRTGRALDSFQGFSIEPRLVELNEIMAQALTFVNEVVCEVESAWFPGVEISGFTGEPTDQGLTVYKPRDVWETKVNAVVYPLPGADINNMTLAAAQLAGSKTGSRRDAASIHPAIHDVDRTMREIIAEELDTATLQGLQQQVVQGAIPPMVVAKVKAKVLDGMTLDEAVISADEEFRKMQAEMAPPAAPEVQPGIAAGMPTGPAPEELPTNIGPTNSQAGFRELVSALRRTAPTPGTAARGA